MSHICIIEDDTAIAEIERDFWKSMGLRYPLPQTVYLD